jgi:hypothetical protein
MRKQKQLTMTKSKPKLYRQGDVLIQRVKTIPDELKRQTPTDGRIILAHGEATGHHHSVDADCADWWKRDGDDSVQFVTVHKPTAVVHQEHNPIALSPGRYLVTRQVEYSPEAIRNVAD